ncbi:hypothetical protein B0A53_00344 [Rhodotorula sp. CCFEE 5036]|nr:hypothetical protein B0A53_00344 [Rhodotorula sp. CCFEE 5036]
MAIIQHTPCSEDVGAKQPNQRVCTADPPSDGDAALQIHLVRVSEAFPAAESTQDDADGSRKSIASFLPFLEAESQQDIGRFRFLRDAQPSQRLGLPWADVTFRTAARGRPEVQHAANASQVLDLNVSHDTNLVAIASVAFAMQTPVRVGLDVMHIKNPWEGSSLDELIEGLAEQASPLQEAFAPLKLDALKEIEDDQARLERILALWTLKESFVKATGDGLHFDLKSLQFRPSKDGASC